MAPGGGGGGRDVNITARYLGTAASPVEALRALGRWREGRPCEGRRVRKPVLRVERPGAEPVCGMFFGAGLVAAGVQYFRRRLEGLRVAGETMSAVAICRVLLGVIPGGGTGETGVQPLRSALDGGPETEHRALLYLVSKLDRLIRGTRPHWGPGAGPLRFTLVEAGARGLWRNLPRLATVAPATRSRRRAATTAETRAEWS